MRAVIAILLCSVAVAGADSRRKTASDKFAKAAGELFARAIAADDKGDTKTALELYAAAFDLTPHENIAFNMAEAQERNGAVRDAIRDYELYLTLAPDAHDRAAIEAKIAQLEHAPVAVDIVASAVVDMDHAYVLVDGDIVARPGAKVPPLHLPPGRHVFDIVTTTTSWSELVFIDVGSQRVKLDVKPAARIEGNAVISAHELAVRVEGHDADPDQTRLQIAPGHHRIGLADRTYECPPFSFDVPRGADLGYVYVGIVELPVKGLKVQPFHCRKLEIKPRTLVFK